MLRSSDNETASAAAPLRAHPADPAVQVHAWRAPRSEPLAAALARARDGLGLEDAAWQRTLRHRGVWIDRQRCGDARTDVPADALVRVYVLASEPEPGDPDAIEIVWQSEDALVVDKPAWWPVSATRASVRLCLETLLRERSDWPELRAVHRLDRQTSGLVVFARDGRAAARLSAALRERRADKRYLAVVRGPWPALRWRCELPLAAGLRAGRHGQTTVANRALARSACTRFAVRAAVGERAWVEARPVTGRTHQIRVHLAASGCPIAGDDRYGDAAAAAAAPRVQLHAWRLDLGEPELRWTAAPPADFAAPPTALEPER